MVLPLTRAAYKLYLKQGVKDFDDLVNDGGEEELDHEGEGHHEKGEHHYDDHDDREHYGEDHEEHGMREHEDDEDKWTLEEFSWFIQFIFVFIALGNASRFGMEIFRFRTVDSYYDNGYLGAKKTTKNWWKRGNDIFLNGAFYIWAAAFIT
jgi:hypothetical protein